MLDLVFNFLQPLLSNILFYSQQYLDRYSFLVPLGFIGIWRWSVWMMKEIIGLHYHPKTKEYEAKVSIVTPVYNEDPKVFTSALESWKRNKPAEIIAVIDHTDTTCINLFKEFKKSFSHAVLIVTTTPGKRQALVDGIKVAKSEIVALVDSDTIWLDNVLRNGLPPFHDKKVAGVATYQSVLHPKTFAQKVFDIQLDLRYRHEYPFLAAAGNALVCLSGRTAFYRRDIVTPMLPELVNETFLGKPVISGDDKRLTYLVLGAGWKVAYQSTSRVYTPGMVGLKAYLKQRLRWTRNSLRADLSAIFSGWPLRHPALLFFQVDKLLQSFVVILSPIFFLVSVYLHLWVAALIIFCWWFISRGIKIYPYLSEKPSDVFILPGYVLFTFVAAIVKIYAMFTLNTQGWITRWDKSRLPQMKLLSTVPAYLGTIGVIMLLSYGVFMYKQHSYLIPHAQQEELLSAALQPISNTALASIGNTVLGASTSAQKDLFTKRYVAKDGETLATIAKKFDVDVNQLFYANSAKLPNRVVAEGSVLSIPGKDLKLEPDLNFTSQVTPQGVAVTYDKSTNTLLIQGRGQKVTLQDIVEKGGKNYLREVEPKVWHATATIFISDGVTLVLDKSEVTWLKLESNKKQFSMLRSMNGDIHIDGVKITSWDSELNDYDKDLDDGRSFVMVKDNARMDIYSSELAYLGFATSFDIAVSPYGVSWKLNAQTLLKGMVTGEVVNSKFHDNYFGTYTFGATGMLWRRNEFYNNVRYGLDPHDDSNGFLVENNIAHDNGTHGIIFSKRCMYNTIRNNVSYNNKLHGIMLHETSNFNIIEGNTVEGNTSGVAVWHSTDNIIRNNIVKDNRHGVRANAGSVNNVIEHNTIIGSTLYGVYFYDKATQNHVLDNTFEGNDVGVYVMSNANDIRKNSFINNAVGVYFQDSASDNILSDNAIKWSKMYGIYTKVTKGSSNVLGNNELYKNRKDIVGLEDEVSPVVSKL